jgi:hypothetical protein
MAMLASRCRFVTAAARGYANQIQIRVITCLMQTAKMGGKMQTVSEGLTIDSDE